MSKGPLDPQNFIAFKIKKIVPYNHNASKYVCTHAPNVNLLTYKAHRFTFELPDNQTSGISVASCVVVKSSDAEALKDNEGKPIIRPYTPISAPDTPGELTLLVKRYEAGNVSKHIHSLKVRL
jgi:cytochrome-b5 reductase